MGPEEGFGVYFVNQELQEVLFKKNCTRKYLKLNRTSSFGLGRI